MQALPRRLRALRRRRRLPRPSLLRRTGTAPSTTTAAPSTTAADVAADTTTTMATTTTTAAPAPTRVRPDGEDAPDFTLTLGQGGSFTLSDEQKPLYMVFWAEW